MISIAFSMMVVLFFTVASAGDDATGTETNKACGEARDKGTDECGQKGGRRFYFDANTKHCQPFVYAGCGGNGNRFGTLSECKSKCSGFVPLEGANGGGEEHHSMVLPVPKCHGGVRAAVDSEARVIGCPAEQCPEGHKCEAGNCCPTSKELVCDIEYDTGRYAFQGSHTPRFFYKKEVNNCLLFTYYGALGNLNNFETYNECMKYCKKA